MRTNTIMLSVFLLATTLAYAQSETGETNSKKETLKVQETSKVKSSEKKEISKIKGSNKSTDSRSIITEQELIEKRKNLGVMELPKP